MKHTPKIEPYVTAKGGVVILNGPFALEEAERVRALCKAAPEMLEALREAESHLAEELADARFSAVHPGGHCPVLDRVRAALAKAKGES